MTILELPRPADPVVSLVMVVYGRYEIARATLESLAATCDVPAEVIVVDNASPDGAGERLSNDVTGAQFVLSPTNLGYGAGVNLGVLYGHGRYVAVLNSDLTFQPRWLSLLVDALERDDAAGAAAPLYLLPSGAVFDGGGMLGADGTGYAFGDRNAPDDPELGFERYADYGSAAALLVRRTAFDAVGGFDPVYGLGYYEDSDLGFALRRAGWASLIVPRARVVHSQGGSFARRHRLALMARNRTTFVGRYAPELVGRPILNRPPFDPRRDLVLRDWWAAQRLLVLDPDARYAALATAVQTRCPDWRVTWVSERAAVPPGEAHPRVEWLGRRPSLERFLEDRRFHYSHVVAAESIDRALADVLAVSQPQAHRHAVPDGGAPDPAAFGPARSTYRL